MAEEFPAGICGRKWWDSTKTVLPAEANPSPCSMELIDIRSNGCPTGFVDRNARSCEEKALDSNFVSGDCTFLFDPTIRTMGFSLSSSSTTSDWNLTLLGEGDGGGDTTLDSIKGTKLNYDHQGTSGSNEQENRSIFKANDFVYSMDQPLQSSANFYDNITTTSQRSSMAFPVGTISNGYSSKLLQSSVDSDNQQKQFLVNNRTINCCSSTNSNELSSCRPMFETHPPRPSLQKQLQPASLQFSSSISPMWKASAAALHAVQSGFFPSSQSKSSPVSILEGIPKCPNLTTKLISCEVIQDSGRVEKKNDNNETLIKRPRSDTPPPLPTFKVRKEKLSDKITTLQQLVSPFGKTDTASVLHEAIEYIKFLHDQVRVLSTLYMKIGVHDQDQEVEEELKNTKETKKQDLRSRGLCLIAIPNTVALANGNTLDFWSPTLGGTFSSSSL